MSTNESLEIANRYGSTGENGKWITALARAIDELRVRDLEQILRTRLSVTLGVKDKLATLKFAMGDGTLKTKGEQ